MPLRTLKPTTTPKTYTNLTKPPKAGEPLTKALVVFQGKGTPYERRLETGVELYWCETLRSWVTMPD